MADSKILCDIFVALLCLGCFAPAYGITGFRNQPLDQLRQISFNQQGQILSDVQQHQHRFGNQGQINDPITQSQSQNSFSRQNLVPINQQTFSQNPSLFIQPPTGFQQQLSQPQLIFQQPLISNEQSFLPLPPSIQQVPTFFQQTNGHQIQQPPFIELPKQQIPPQPPTQNTFLPTIPTQNSVPFGKFNFQNSQPSQISTNNIIKTNHADLPFQSNLGVNPLFSTNQNSQLQSILEEQRKEDIERLKELQERQNIIQKHKQFLDRQQQKQQQKVHKLHEEFTLKQKKKQEEIYATAQPESDFTLNTQSKPRGILPHESGLFQKAVKQYNDLHPTTPISTTTTTTTPKPVTRPKTRTRAKSRSEANNPELYLQNNRQKIYKEIKTVLQNDEDPKKGNKENQDVTPSKLQYLQRQDLLKQLKLAIAENSNDYVGKNFSSREISLPTGEKFQLIKTSDPNLIAQAKPLTADSSMLSEIVSPNQIRIVAPPKLSSFDDITKGVLPPGTDYEVIKQSGNGKLEEVGNLPSSITNKKKVTFVFIEEQGDGSYKVKGVRGNEKNENQPSVEVDSILKKINEGKIQLPSVSPRTSFSTTTKSPLNTIEHKPTTYSRPITTYSHSTSSSDAASIYDDFEATKLSSQQTSSTPNYYNSPSPSSLSINHHGSPQPSPSVSYDSTTPSSQSVYTSPQARSNTERNSPSSVFYTKSPSTTVNGHQMYPTTKHNHNSDSTYNSVKETIHYSQTAGLASPTVSSYTGDTISIVPSSSTYYPNPNLIARSTTPKSVPETAGTQVTYSTRSTPGLVEIFKENGLFATAKYLKQSGLDAILNETGPYTIFAPTDKAFRTLLIQLGGPDKAEEKFKENPRLLSGLLLHHVIPGAFEISTLQDEMTGVSLAGTQLRVNQYDMHDVEWNEIKVTTVNGARVITEKQDITIPQGIAHAVDRVMFPLPVGDIVQTLQADRERRFTNFLKALFTSGVIESLSDTKTYTVFAPTDRAFSSLKSDELQKLISDKDTAKEFVMKHITPGTLFSAGMRYYQVRDSMDEGKPITLQKNAGRIKVNSGHVITHNIPSTNGVIHAIDTLL